MSEVQAPAKTNNTQNNHNLTPGALHVIKRTGQTTNYEASKIGVAITKAFLAVEGDNAAQSKRIHEIVEKLTNQITHKFNRRLPTGGTIHIEEIQDQVELALMRAAEELNDESLYRVAKAYVLYREEHRKKREQEAREQTADHTLNVTLDDGRKVPLDILRLNTLAKEATEGLEDTDASIIIKETMRNLFDGVPVRDVNRALIMSTRTLIEKEPNYTYAAARMLLNDLRQEALQFLGMNTQVTQHDMQNYYAQVFTTYIEKGIELEFLDPKLQTYDLHQLGQALTASRDMQFTYLGLQTLYDRYFIHYEDIRLELPQVFFMRIAMGLALNEKEKEKRAIEFYHLLSSFDYMSSTPTLFNSGTLRPQLSSCYLTTVPDDLAGIYNAVKDNALLSKYAGGLGNDWTPVRAMNAYIKGTNGKSQGVVPFLKVANDTAVAVNQGGRRKGVACAYLETWHLDIEEFLELRKNTGDERRRTHDMNTANWIPDLFLKRVHEKANWTLFSPNETPDLHDVYGLAFEKAYTQYEAKAKKGELKNFKVIPALTLWRKMLNMVFETGHPWITFKDPCNLRSPQQHTGVVHSSNLCTEITLNTSVDEIAVCNLGSINLPQHIKNGELDAEKIKKTVNTAIRMLDNVIDINFYSVIQARRSNLRHRPIGMGIMGFQDALYMQNIAYTSEEAVEFADKSMELISYHAIKASSDLAEERGPYATFEGSLWSQGILPIDSIKKVQEVRGQYLEQDTKQTLDWNSLRQRVKTVGMRNSNVLAIAPTATISNICGVSQSIEPTYQNLFVKSNLSGEFTVINLHLVRALKALNLWDEVMVNDLKYFNGSIKEISRIPRELKSIYATAFEVDPKWLIDCGSRRMKWIDQSQSLNLYLKEPSGKKLDTMYKYAWTKGLKTTYYLRTMGATHPEKSTIADGALNAVPTAPSACSIDEPDCEACQ